MITLLIILWILSGGIAGLIGISRSTRRGYTSTWRVRITLVICSCLLGFMGLMLWMNFIKALNQ